MKNNPLISVVIPCYNHQAFIKETISSVLKSKYQPIEIIVVNDGSSDNSEQEIKILQEKYDNLKYIYQKNAGPSVARNTGISNAKGKYILPLDADDLISDNYIKNAVEIFESNSSVKVVYCEAEFFGNRTGKWNLPPFRIDKLATDNMIFCSGIYRKQDWQEVGGYDERMTWGWEDWEFWISILKNGGEVVRLPFTGFYYRIHENSRRKSTNKSAKKKTIELINQKHRSFVNSHLNGPLHFKRSLSKKINIFKTLFKKS